MPRLTEKELVEQVAARLLGGESVKEIAAALGYANVNTLYQQLYRLGYKVGKRLVPIHAEPLDKVAV